jgi:hypothetical protein
MILSGSFTTVGGQSRGFVASVDPTSGTLTGWNPGINAPFQAAGGTAFTISSYGNTLYAFGNSGGAQVYTPLLQFSTTTGSGTESNSPSVAFELSEVTTDPITITLSTSGTALLNTDYTLPVITFPAGQLSYSFPLTILDDSLVEGDETVVLTILSASPTSTQFNNNTSFTYTIVDNETAGLSVTESGGTTNVTESGGTDTLSLVLTGQPSADVVVTLSTSSTVSTSPSVVTFTTSTWNVPQNVTVSAVDDVLVQGTHTGTVSFAVSSADGSFNGIAVTSVIVNVTDNDSASSGGGGGGGLGAPGVTAIPPPVTTFQSTQPVMPSVGIAAESLIKLVDDGNPQTQQDSVVYYVGTDGKRHAFTNEKVYFTWYEDFSAVQLVSDLQLASLELGPNITYKPGIRLVKFTTDPKVYAVGKGGVLRWIISEEVATALYGDAWNTVIDDISDAFYTDYHFGTDIRSVVDYSPIGEAAAAKSPSDSFVFSL